MGENHECAECGNIIQIPDEQLEGGLTLSDLVDAIGRPLCSSCFAVWRTENPPPPERGVPQRDSKYWFTEDMDEISGFGGGYEQTCRNMLSAGLEWLDENPQANPKFHGFKDIYGVLADDNEDAKGLSQAAVDGSDGDCTGAMHHAVISHCLFVYKNGWEHYCVEMRKRELLEEKRL